MSKKISLLQDGDVIKLTAEHTVYAQVPKHFVYSNDLLIIASCCATCFFM